MSNNVFLLMLHKDSDHVRCLINLLSSNSDVFIHVDKKCDKAFDALINWCKLNDFKHNVIFIKERIPVYWAHSSQLLATLNLIKEARKFKSYDYFTFLSGECFPIRRLEEYDDFLRKSNETNFLAYSDASKFHKRITMHHWGMKFGLYKSSVLVRKLFFVSSLFANLIVKRQGPLQKMKFYKGSSWFTLHRNFIDHVIESSNNTELMRSVEYTSCVDEIFFHTLLKNSSYKDKLLENNLRFIRWSNKSNSPRRLNISDLDCFGTAFFARKLDVCDGSELSNRILSIHK